MTQRKANTTTSLQQLSVIVPAYNETDNIEALTERLFQACSDNNIQGKQNLQIFHLSFSYSLLTPYSSFLCYHLSQWIY